MVTSQCRTCIISDIFPELKHQARQKCLTTQFACQDGGQLSKRYKIKCRICLCGKHIEASEVTTTDPTDPFTIH